MTTSSTTSPVNIPVNVNLAVKHNPKTATVTIAANGLPNGVGVSLKDWTVKPSSNNVKRALFHSEYEDDFDSMMDECKLVHSLSFRNFDF